MNATVLTNVDQKQTGPYAILMAESSKRVAEIKLLGDQPQANNRDFPKVEI